MILKYINELTTENIKIAEVYIKNIKNKVTIT